MSQQNAQSDWQQRHDAPKPEPRPDLPSASLPPEPQKSRKAGKAFLGLVGAFVILMVGYGIGQSGMAPAPAAKTEIVTKTPATCTEALNSADAVIATAGEGFSITAEAMTAAGNLDAAGIDAATAKLTALNGRLTPQLSAYRTARDACEAN